MSRVFNAINYLLTLAVLAQIFLAGYAASTAQSPTVAFATHRDVGHMIIAGALIAALVALIGRLPRRLIGFAFLTIGLLAVQLLLGMANQSGTTASQVMIGIHALNALAIMGSVTHTIQYTHEHHRNQKDQTEELSPEVPAHRG